MTTKQKSRASKAPKVQFWVTATEDVGPRIQKGDSVLIDPNVVPAPGRYVLLDGRLLHFRGGKKRAATGVAVQVSRDLSGVAVGHFSPEDTRHG